MSTETPPERADSDELDDASVDPSSTSPQDSPTPDQSPDDETPPESEKGESDTPDAPRPPSTFRAAIRSEPTPPALKLPASVTVDRDTLRQGVKAADLVADHVGFRVDPDEEVFRIDAEGDTDSVDFRIDADDWEAVTLAEASSLFSLDHMKMIVRTIPAGTTVTINFGTEFPAILSYDLGDGGRINEPDARPHGSRRE